MSEMAEQRLAMPDRADPSHSWGVVMVTKLYHKIARRPFLDSRLG